MPTSMMLWILFGVGGLIIGFLIGYLFFGRSAHVSRRELENLRNLAEQRRTELAAANQRLDFLQEALEDKTIRERRAMETLQRALQADEEEYSSKDPKLRPM